MWVKPNPLWPLMHIHKQVSEEIEILHHILYMYFCLQNHLLCTYDGAPGRCT
jgi:hypothetical protein